MTSLTNSGKYFWRGFGISAHFWDSRRGTAGYSWFRKCLIYKIFSGPHCLLIWLHYHRRQIWSMVRKT